MLNPEQPIDLIILAGGEGRRLGGCNKALLTIEGESFLERLTRRFMRDGDQLIIAANPSLGGQHAAAGRVVMDLRSGGAGPLAGLEAALANTSHRYQLVIPCDMPWLPADLRQRLLSALEPDRISVARDPERLQPLCLAMSGERWRKNLSAFLDTGQRSAMRWLADRPLTPVDWEDSADFRNVNRPEDLP